MHFDLMPDNRGIIAILNESVEGPYRFVHNAFIPYVRLAPATDTELITIWSSSRLQLMRPEDHARQLSGRDAVLDFAVVFHGGSETLQELGRRAVILDSIDPQHPLSHRLLPGKGVPRRSLALGTPHVQEVPEGGIVESLPKPAARKLRTQIVVAPAPPAAVDIPVPELLDMVRQAEGLEPDRGDYLVIPKSSVPTDERLPPWVVRTSHVDVMHVHKPRLDKHYALMPVPPPRDD